MKPIWEPQFADRAAVEELQLAKARRLLDRVRTNCYYGPRFADTGVTAASLQDLSQWRELPTIDKSDVLEDQLAHPPYGSRLGVDESEVCQVHLTSGTSGMGQEAMGLTAADADTAGLTWRPPLRSMGVDKGEVFATFYPISFLTYGRSLMDGGRVNGIPILPLAGIDRTLAVSLLRRLQPSAIGARPALYRLIAEELATEGKLPRDAFPGVKALLCSGISPVAALHEQEDWDATVHELYGSSQAGGIAAVTGPEGAAPDGEPGVMRILEQHYLIEAVHPQTLEPVQEGEAELLLTCLDRVASPLIRYRTRDRVEVVPPGTYGDGSPLMGIRVGSVGRWDDMLKIRGNNVWPSQLDEAVLGHRQVTDYRAYVRLDGRGVDTLSVVIRPEIGVIADEPLLVDVQRRVKMATNVRPVVECDPDMPPPELKPKRLLDRRKS